MADTDHTEQQKHIASLYRNLKWKNCNLVSTACDNLPEGPLQRISLHNDTVLHLAAHSKQKDLVLDLLKKLPKDRNHKLSDIINNDGNTILHEAATSDAMIYVTQELLRRDASLLIASNDLGETPIFCAARYGQIVMFKFLAGKMELEQQSPEDCKAQLQRNDGTTVLHISIASECFELASHIADCYPYLIDERDQSSMTALQYLACNPTAFQNEKTQIKRGFLEQLSKSKESENETKRGFIGEGIIWSIKFFYTIASGKVARYDRTMFLVKSLVEKDTSWDVNINSQVVGLYESKEAEIEEHSSKLSQMKERQNSQENSTSKYKKRVEIPLFLATMSNIKEIIEEILSYHPQALEYTNKEGRNILHVAILYRHIDIFDMVVNSEVLAKRLLSATDNEGNSVLHMVSQKRSQANEKMQSPALQLQDELLLFERVKLASKISYPLNNKNKTAEELFAAGNEELHKEAKEWLMRTTENCTILSVFIATVAFAAAYTVPGGPDQGTGIPILHSKPFFMVFIIADVISLTLALTSVGIFLSILTSSFPLEDFKTYLFKKLRQGIICLVLSVSMMAVAFGATIVLIMTHNRENVVWDVVAFLPVPIFFLSYSPLRSIVLGLEPYRETFRFLVVNFLTVFLTVFLRVVAIMVAIFLFLILLLYGAFRRLLWTVKKAPAFICKPVRWMSGKKSQPKSDTQSPQPTTAAPLTQV